MKRYLGYLDFFVRPFTENIVFFVMLVFLQFILSASTGSIFVRLVLEIILDTYFVTLCLSILPKKVQRIIQPIVCVFAYTLAFIDLESTRITGLGISPSLIQLCIQTNPQEMHEAYNSYFSVIDCFQNTWMVGLLALIHFLMRRWHPLIPPFYSYWFGCFFLVLFSISSVLSFEKYDCESILKWTQS